MKRFFQNLSWKLARLEFYKKKPFAVTCTVIFSVLLAFDLAIAVFVPNTNSIGGMQGFSASDLQELSTEFDMSDLPGGASGGDSDSDNSSGSNGIPGGMGDFDMDDLPEDFDMDDLPEDFDMEDMQSFMGGDMSGYPGSDSDSSSDSSSDASDSDSDTSSGTSATRGSGIMGFLRGVKSHWILIAVILAILDIFSIVRFVFITRRIKAEREEEARIAREKMLAGQIVHTAHPTVKHKKVNAAAVWAIPMVGVLLLVAVVKGLSAGSATTVESTSASVYSGTAETTSLDTVLSGAGTLEEEDAESMELNSAVEISTWYVSNGDTVAEGDTLAAVDKVSVMSAIASLQEQMDELDAQLAEYETEEIDDTITAASDGRVMAIYAEKDTSVVDTMYDYGSLMLLSIDGYLAVDLETEEELQAGDSVTVILSDDTEVTGKVGTYLDGTAVILVSDEEASLGEEVSVETEDGDEIGSGSLYIHNQLAVTGFLGTVDEISVEVGDEVESGDTLLTLTDTEYAGTYETLLAQRSELEEEMQELFILYQDPYLYAVCAGVVSGIEDDTTTTDSGSSDSSSDSDSTDDSSSSDGDSDDSDSGSSDDSDDSSASAADDNIVLADNDAAGNEESTESDNDITAATATVCTVNSGNTTASAGNLSSSSATTGTAVTISATTSTSGGYENYIGVVQSVDDSSATATVSFLTGVYEISDYSDLSDYDLSADNLTESYTIDMSSGTILFTYSSSSLAVGSAADIAAGDILVISYENGGSPGLGSTPVWMVRVVEDSSEGDASSDTDFGDTESDSEADSSAGSSDTESDSTESSSDSSSDSTSGDSGMSGDSSTNLSDTSDLTDSISGTDSTSTGSADASDEADGGSSSTAYTVSKTTLLEITPQDSMTITITIDELDILSLEEGQTAQVTLDAFPGQAFEGEVTDIDLSGTNSGGSTKFTAEVTIAREDDMLAGMNASAVITIDTTENVLCIPEDALVEEDGVCYVYTTYDEKNEELGGLIEVTTGLSDGESVEILSGLDEGDSYYYSILDVVNYSTSSASSGSSFSMDSLFSSGGRGGM